MWPWAIIEIASKKTDTERHWSLRRHIAIISSANQQKREEDSPEQKKAEGGDSDSPNVIVHVTHLRTQTSMSLTEDDWGDYFVQTVFTA